MRLLLDTHTLLWAVHAPERLPPKVLDAFDRAEVTVAVSAASTWEIAIKVALGRLRFPIAELPHALAAAAFEELPVRIAHGMAMAALPLIHRDPFDRLLIAQARHERMTLVTCDSAILRYPIDTLWD